MGVGYASIGLALSHRSILVLLSTCIDLWLLRECLQVCRRISRQRCLVMRSTITTIVLFVARLLLPQLAVFLIIVDFFNRLARMPHPPAQIYWMKRRLPNVASSHKWKMLFPLQSQRPLVAAFRMEAYDRLVLTCGC